MILVWFVQSSSCALSTPVLQTFWTIVTGWVFAPRRTITAMWVVTGKAGKRHHAALYRLFSAACWCSTSSACWSFAALCRGLDGHRPAVEGRHEVDSGHTQ